MNCSVLADRLSDIGRFVFVDRFSVFLSCIAVAVSVVALWREISAGKPRISVWFELQNAEMLPDHHFVYGVLLVSNVGKCAFSIRRAGLLLVNGAFAPNVNCPHSFPLALRPGDSIEIPVSTNAGWIVRHPLVPAVELGNGKIVSVRPFFRGFEDFVGSSRTGRNGLLDRRHVFPRRLRRAFVENAHRKRDEREN